MTLYYSYPRNDSYQTSTPPDPVANVDGQTSSLETSTPDLVSLCESTGEGVWVFTVQLPHFAVDSVKDNSVCRVAMAFLNMITYINT